MTQKYLRIIAAIAIVVAAPFAYSYMKIHQDSNTSQNAAGKLLSSEYAVKDVSTSSFGKLNSLTAAATKSTGRGANPVADQAESTSTPLSITPQNGSGGGASAKIVPPYFPEEYKFKYAGGDLPNLDPTQYVYKRVNQNVSTSVIDRVIKTLSLGLIDLTKFESTKLQSFVLSEDKDFGYSISVDVDNGSLSMYQNYLKWPQPQPNCNEKCYQAQMPKLSDIPEDSALIDIANKFVSDKSISLNGYGTPVVESDWREQYQNSTDKANFYFPEIIDVVYPILIDGKAVYNEGGSPAGMNISIDYRRSLVTGLYDLATKSYERSSFSAVTDSKQILDIAEKGGFRSYNNPGIKGAKIINLELMTPTVQILRMWRYDGTTNEEVFVPSLVFPIKNPKPYWQKNVVVPLVQDILDNTNTPPINYLEKGDAMPSPAAAPTVLPKSSQ